MDLTTAWTVSIIFTGIMLGLSGAWILLSIDTLRASKNLPKIPKIDKNTFTTPPRNIHNCTGTK